MNYAISYPSWFKKITCGIEAFKRLVSDHLSGRHRLGLFPLIGQNLAYNIMCDFEDHGYYKIPNPLESAIKLKQFLHHYFIPSYLETSKSQNAYHLWIFFKEPINAIENVFVLESILNKFQNINIEIFPKPNQEKGGSTFLPLFGGIGDQLGGGIQTNNTVFIDNDGKPIPDQKDYISQFRYASEIDFKSKETTFNFKKEHIRQNKKAEQESKTKPVAVNNIILKDGLDKVTQNCKFIKHWSKNQNSLTEYAWEAGINNLHLFTNGNSYIHEKSKTYNTRKYRYSFRLTQRKIIRIRNFSKPYTCETINTKCGFKCSNYKVKKCNVKCPASLGLK